MNVFIRYRPIRWKNTIGFFPLNIKLCNIMYYIIKENSCTVQRKIHIFEFWPKMKNVIGSGPHFLCWILGVVPFNTWLISSWEENKFCYKLSKCTKWHLFHSKWSKLSFWIKIHSCHFVSCSACNNSYFLLSLR